MSLETFNVIETQNTTWDQLSTYTWDSINVVVNLGSVAIQDSFSLTENPVLVKLQSCSISGAYSVLCVSNLVLVTSCAISEEVTITVDSDVFETYFTQAMLDYFPHRWLNPNDPGVQRLIGGLGKTFGRWHPDFVGNVKAQQAISTAGSDGLYYWENDLGIKPNPSLPLETRRANVLARMMNRGGPTTKPLLEQALTAYGVTAEVIQDPASYTVTVKVLDPKGTPKFLTEMQDYAREVVHAHLGINWELAFITWGELESRWATFNDLEPLTFDELEVF